MKRSGPAFVLVEIVIALAVVSFTIIVLLGLLSTGIRIGKNSKTNTTIALMSRQVLSSLQQQPFTNLGYITSSSGTEVAFFDENGTRLQNTNTTPPTDITRTQALANGGIYECSVTAQNDTNIPGQPPSSTNLLNLTLTFTWPIQAPTSPNSFTVNASLANYY